MQGLGWVNGCTCQVGLEQGLLTGSMVGGHFLALGKVIFFNKQNSTT